MSRLPLVDPASAPEKVREVFEVLPVSLNIFKMAAHAETCFRPLLRLGSAILTEQELAGDIREMAVLLAAKVAGGEYEWVQHVPIAQACGVRDDQIAALERGDLSADCFDAKEKACLSFIDETARISKPSDATFAAAYAHLNEREIVELILTIGYYQMMARLTECTDTDIDEPAGTKVVEAARSGRIK